MKPHFGLWIIGSFFITTYLAEEIPEKTVSKFRSKRFFDNLDFASQNGWLDGRPQELPILRPRTNNFESITAPQTPLAEVTPEKTCLRYRQAEKKSNLFNHLKLEKLN